MARDETPEAVEERIHDAFREISYAPSLATKDCRVAVRWRTGTLPVVTEGPSRGGIVLGRTGILPMPAFFSADPLNLFLAGVGLLSRFGYVTAIVEPVFRWAARRSYHGHGTGLKIRPARHRGQGSVEYQDLARGMTENRSVSGTVPPEGLPPFKELRRQNGRFSAYPFGTRRISALTSLKSPCGGRHHRGLFASPGPKSDTRHACPRACQRQDPGARDLILNRP